MQDESDGKKDSKEKREAVADAISTSLEDLEEKPSVRMFLITETKNKLEPYILYKINIKGKVPEYFRDTLEKKLKAIKQEIKDESE